MVEVEAGFFTQDMTMTVLASCRGLLYLPASWVFSRGARLLNDVCLFVGIGNVLGGASPNCVECCFAVV